MRSPPCLVLSTLALVTALPSCKRPVTGRELGGSIVSDLRVDPPFIRADVPIDVSFRVTGAPPSTLQINLGGSASECPNPVRESDGRYHCELSGLSRPDHTPGAALVIVQATDDRGRTSSATTQVTIDFECPQFVSLGVSPRIASPGTRAIVIVETNEALREPPIVTFFGRSWEAAVGQGQTFSITHDVTIADPSTPSEIVVRIADLAGNTSGDCGSDGRIPFAVDHLEPVLDATKIMLSRGAPGTAAILSALPGAFLDDVGIREVRVFDETGALMIASVSPLSDGSLDATSLGTQTTSRVLLEAIDLFGRTSARVTVSEAWRLSIGTGDTPNSAIRTGVRFTEAPPGSQFLHDRTLDLAQDVLEEDTRLAVVRARVGFEAAGSLPQSYEDTFWIQSGYDVAGKAIVGFGGLKTVGNFDRFADRTLIIRWNPASGIYEWEFGPSFDLGRTPTGRGGHNIAFNGRGCGIMFGGYGLAPQDDGNGGVFYNIRMLNDVWQICSEGGEYAWSPIRPTNADGTAFPLIRRTPIVHDPSFDRYVVLGGASNANGFGINDALLLEPGATTEGWEWVPFPQLPTAYSDTDRLNHLVYYDPRLAAFATGLGATAPYDRRSNWWVYRGGQWTLSTIPNTLYGRQGFGYDYDRARNELVFWGDNDSPTVDGDTWFLTGTATSSPGGWRRADLNPPLPRGWPSMVYDADREVFVIFGGVRFDGRFVPPDIFTMTTQPSYPYLQANIDLGADRPKGIDKVSIRVRARAIGDADGIGPSTATAGGFRVLLWDHEEKRWDLVSTIDTGSEAQFSTARLDIATRPERFVSPEGVVPMTISSRAPATEAMDARLEVDLIDGAAMLRPGVSLP